MAREFTIPGIWAEEAETTIPIPPEPGVAYRKPEINLAEWKRGWPYKKIVDSRKWNQLLYMLTGIIQSLEQAGILTWSEHTEYSVNAITMSADGVLYQATAASGPNSGGAKPPPDNSYWKLLIDATPSDGGDGGESGGITTDTSKVGAVYINATSNSNDISIPPGGTWRGIVLAGITNALLGYNATVHTGSFSFGTNTASFCFNAPGGSIFSTSGSTTRFVMFAIRVA